MAANDEFQREPPGKTLIRQEPTDGTQSGMGGGHYLPPDAGRLYVLALITDQWSRKIVGFHLGETLAVSSVIRHWRWRWVDSKGARNRSRTPMRVSVSSHAYVQRVGEAGMKMCMTEQNHTAENALAERVNGILKQGVGWTQPLPPNRRPVRPPRAVHLSNHRRPHTAPGFRTPEKVHNTNAKN